MQPELLEHAYALERPEVVKTRKNFESNIDNIATAFAKEGFPIRSMIAQLHATESERLLEAVHTYLRDVGTQRLRWLFQRLDVRLP